MPNDTALWAATLGTTVGEAWLRRDEPKPPAAIARFREAAELLARGVPFAYAVGRVPFRTLDLAIDARALIPRPETEGLVALVLARCSGGFAADIGTGSGCIALSLAVEGRFEKIIAVEQSPAAAALARQNVLRIAPGTPVEIRIGNLLGPLVENGDRFRVIVSNPPYLTAAEYEALDALVSGTDGLAATRALLAGAADLLEPQGVLALEIDERRAGAVRALAHEYGWHDVAIHADLFGCPRYLLAFTP